MRFRITPGVDGKKDAVESKARDRKLSKRASHIEIWFSSDYSVFKQGIAQVLHSKRRPCFILVRSESGRKKRLILNVLTLDDCPKGARPRPLAAAFVRIRACWKASAAISETNFCAASANNLFLKGKISSVIPKKKSSVKKPGYPQLFRCVIYSQTYIFTLKPNPLQVVVGDFVRNLVEWQFKS